VKEALKEGEEEKERGTLCFSSVSRSKVMSYLESIDVIMLVSEPLDVISTFSLASTKRRGRTKGYFSFAATTTKSRSCFWS
jgi:hypothetical protein